LDAELAALKAGLAEVATEAEAAKLVKRRRDVEADLSIRRQALAQLRATAEARARAERERAEQERRQAVEAERSRRSAALIAKRKALAAKLEELTAELASLAGETHDYEVWIASADRRPCRDLASVVADVAGSLLRDAGLMLTPVFGERLRGLIDARAKR
jgi:hypothetical protein